MLISIPHYSDQEIKTPVNGSLKELGDTDSILLTDSAKKHHWKGEGPLSLKLYLSGQASFTVNNQNFVIDEQSYLVVNNGEPYEVIIDEEREVEAFCIFFQRSLLPELMRFEEYSDSALLDSPFLEGKSDTEFYQNTFRRNKELDSKIYTLQAAVNANADMLSLEILIREVLGQILRANYSLQEKERRLDFAKKSTREELIKRLLIARDFIHASYQHNITLDDIAKKACLSVNHLMRTFKQAFRQTPNQYIMDLRINKAQKLLVNHRDLSVTRICHECGFESLGYFSSLFKRSSGASPTEYRSNSY